MRGWIRTSINDGPAPAAPLPIGVHRARGISILAISPPIATQWVN